MTQSNGYDENVIPFSTNEKVSQQWLVHTQNENALGSNNSPHMENRFLYFSNLNNDDNDDDAYKRDNLKLKEFSKCPPPLGLKLTITPSLMQSIEEKLNGVAETVTPWQPPPPAKKDEKLKAVHFPMHLLRFGLFKIEAKYASHLVAKCYYAKRKLVWEILRNGLKEKIEIQWQNILAIRAVIAENNPGILEIELAREPSFFRETEPKPGKHTRWDICGDFTAGQASKYRRHYLQFHPGVLDQHYVKLLQCDNRLLELSKGPFPSLQSPYFDSHLDQGTTHFSIGHVLHVHESKTTSGSEQQPILKLPKIPTQRVQLFGNRMSLSPIAINDPTTPTSDICSPTNEAIINNQMLQETTHFLSGHDLHIHGSKTTSASEQQLICQQPVVPTQQVQQFGNMMPLSLIANDPTSPTLDICSPTNETIINNQMLQETTLFLSGHDLHVPGSKTTLASEQQLICQQPVVPTQQVQQFGNMMPLSLIANDPTSPTLDICSPTNETIINNQMLQETTLFLSGHDLHVPGSKTTLASEQQLICQQPVVPTQQVQQFGNMMPLSLIANDPTSPTLDICSPTNETIINNQMLQETTLFLSGHDLHVHGSKTTSASEQQLICQQPAVPTHQFGNMMTLSLIANDPTSDICSPANEAINNQMLQDPDLAAWSEPLYYETLFPMESVPCTSNLQRNGPVSNYELPNNNNNMLLTGYNIPETVFDRRHMGNIVKLINANAIADLSMEAGPACNTNTSTQIYQPNTSENSWNALDGLVQQQYYASNANLNPMHGNPFVDPRLFNT